MQVLRRSFLAGMAMACALPLADAQEFRGLGTLPGGTYSRANAVSGDGSVVVGSANDSVEGGSLNRAVRWTPEGLWALDGSTEFGSSASAVSSDGQAIVGNVGSGPFRWTPDGLELLDLVTDEYGSALGMSGDGTVVVGDLSNDLGSQAFRWTSEGFVKLTKDPSGAAVAVSRDASTIIGYSGSKATTSFVWTVDTGAIPLLDAPGPVRAVSADGSVIVGGGGQGAKLGGEAYYWTAEDGAVLLDPDGSFSPSVASAVNDDASLIVGTFSSDGGGGKKGADAMIWDADHGTRSLKTVLETEYGLDLTGWTLTEATGISGDGNVIVGNGYNPAGASEAWIAILHTEPEPLPVTINVRPHDDDNTIKLKPGKPQPKKLRIAILSTPDFDARTVVPLSIELGPILSADAEPELVGVEPIDVNTPDVNKDGLRDLVLIYDTQGLVDEEILVPEMLAMALEGETLDGTVIVGSDVVDIELPKKKKKTPTKPKKKKTAKKKAKPKSGEQPTKPAQEEAPPAEEPAEEPAAEAPPAADPVKDGAPEAPPADPSAEEAAEEAAPAEPAPSELTD